MPFQPLKEIKEGDEEQAIEVRICRKWISKSLVDGVELSVDCIFIDKEGQAIQATMSMRNGDRFNFMLTVGNICHISNFYPMKNTLQFPAVDQPVYLEINKQTKIEHVPLDIPNFPRYYFWFTEIDALTPHQSNARHYPDIIGRLLKMQKIERTPVNVKQPAIKRIEVRRNVVLEGLRKTTISVTLWGQVAESVSDDLFEVIESPVILVFTNMYIKRYKGETSASTTIYSVHFQDPDIPETATYKKAFASDMKRVQLIRSSRMRAISFEEMKKENRESISKLLRKKGSDCFDELQEASVIILGKTMENFLGTSCKNLVSQYEADDSKTLPHALSQMLGQNYIFELTMNQWKGDINDPNAGSPQNCVNANFNVLVFSKMMKLCQYLPQKQRAVHPLY